MERDVAALPLDGPFSAQIWVGHLIVVTIKWYLCMLMVVLVSCIAFRPFPWRDASIGQLCFDACRWALNVHSTPQHRDIPSSHDLCNTRARSSWHLFASHLARVTLFRHFRPWPFALALLAFARLGPLSVDLRTADQATVTRSILARRWVLLVLGHHRAFQRLPGCAALHTLKTLVHYLRQQ